MTTTPLLIEAQKENLPEVVQIDLSNSFHPFFQEAEKLKAEAMSIVVKDINDKETIEKAREMRLTMKRIRTSTENARKSLKEESLRRGRAIDGMANMIKFVVVPIEEHLEKQENFVKIQAQKQIDELKAVRVKELAEFGVDAALYTNLGEMPEDQYKHLMEGAKHAHALKVESEKKAEEERKKKAEEDEKERLRLKAEKDEADRVAAEERKKREAAEAELKKQREAKEAEEKRKKKEEADAAKAAKKAAAAPDKVKLESLAVYIESIAMPLVKDEDAQAIVTKTLNMLADASAFIRKSASEL